MPADPSGVTTDDQGSHGNGADDRSPAETQDGRSAPPSTGDKGGSGSGAETGDKPARKGGSRKRSPRGGDAGTSEANGTPAPAAGDDDTSASTSTSASPAADAGEEPRAGGDEPSAPAPDPATDPTLEQAAQPAPTSASGSSAAQTAEIPTTDPSADLDPAESPASDLSAAGDPAGAWSPTSDVSAASDPIGEPSVTTDLSADPEPPPAPDLGAGPLPVSDPVPGADPDVAPAPDLPGGPAVPGAEPPPAPVLTPGAPTAPAGLRRRREGRGRHATPRRDRAAMRGLRVNQRLWSVDPWSVFKLSILFYFCVALIVLVAGTLLYNAGRRVGTVDQFESFITRMGAYGECVATADVPEGTDFEEDEDECAEGEVLVGGFELDDGTLFRTAAVGGGILVLAGSIGNVLMTVLVNLLNEVTGGLRHSVVKEPVARPRADRPAGPPRQRRQQGVPKPAASGSPARQPQG